MTDSRSRHRSFVVMGVAGCGKSSLGAALAAALALPLVEGDDHHSAESRAKMSRGIALDDADRAGWLDRLGAELARHAAQDGGAVLSCSALKRAYRDRLRAACPGLRFVFLDLDRDEALRRVASRASHFFSSSLVDSQFATLERPEAAAEPDVLTLPATLPIEALCAAVVTAPVSVAGVCR
ncbi:carbohydrate kinase [Sphaerotilus natans subsp. natans DSM 6575]|uniref:Gluconokinase n=1 Tax=Sphaerotilus natans subsp. natans DSM 6575 TaxID=1286631 RepID=A0A059KKF4_9BURK|nr:gluconokinase [Sphaerotilus natans]KDB51936.1 carbohydrate kinase [Sphaerotilus natans subsp. natans DSM 6575]